MKPKFIFLILLFLSMSDCAVLNQATNKSVRDTATININFNIYRDEIFNSGNINQSKFFLVLNTTMTSMITSRRLADQVANLLENKGFNVTDKPAEAKYLIVYDARIGEKDQISIRPVWSPGQTFRVNNTLIQTADSVSYIPRHDSYLKRQLSLQVYDADRIRNDKTETSRALWIYEASSAGHLAGLNEAIPFLLAPAEENLFSESEDQQSRKYEIEL